jgi:hypothetical protein
MTFADPTDDIMSEVREIAFRTAVYLARDLDQTYHPDYYPYNETEWQRDYTQQVPVEHFCGRLCIVANTFIWALRWPSRLLPRRAFLPSHWDGGIG